MYEIFERLLKERGLKMSDVCRVTGIRQSTMSNWKKRRNMLSPDNLKKIADYFGLPIDYFMNVDDKYQIVYSDIKDENGVSTKYVNKELIPTGFDFLCSLDNDTVILLESVVKKDNSRDLLNRLNGYSPEQIEKLISIMDLMEK